MSSLTNRVEFLANIAIVVVAILLGLVLIKSFLPTPPSQSSAIERPRILPGTKLTVDDVDWSKREQSLLMVLSTNCRYCTESIPFYQRLVQKKGARQDVQLVAVLPQIVGEAQKYLSDHAISVDGIKQTLPGADYARATPTLIIVDRTGAVVESWVGKLPPEKELEVLSRFLGEPKGNK